MDPVELRKVIAVLHGHWAGREAPPDVHVAEFGTDSRTLSGTGVFVALRGERTDGHAHVAEARRRGALASVVSRGVLPDLPTDGGPYIAVDDPLTALERLGAWNRERLDLSVVGITGSVGKTSTKGFLGAVLSSKYNVRVAPKSFNNRLGVALTLLSAAACDDILVAELGTSGPGELSHLSGLVRPQRIVLTEIGAAHLQGLKDLDGVVEAKAEVLDGLDADGTLFLRHGVYGHQRFGELSPRPPITFGWATDECPGAMDRSQPDLAVSSCASVSLDRTGANPAAYGYRFTINDAEDLVLPVPGRHNVLNAAAAIAVARDLGMDWQEIRGSLLSCRLPPQRVQIFEIGGVVVMDDSYNANPGSMEAAISEWQTLARPDKTQGGSVRVAVLGDMLELGKDSRQHHEAVGRHLAASDARVVVTVGDESRWIQDGYRASGGDAETAHFPSVEPALPYLRGAIQKGDRVLFKASRAIGLDRIVAELRGALAPRETEGSYGGAGSTCSLS